jgi:predicted small secreted protein
MKRIISAVLVVMALSASLSACNTMSGLGQDIQRGGQKLEDAADKKK